MSIAESWRIMLVGEEGPDHNKTFKVAGLYRQEELWMR